MGMAGFVSAQTLTVSGGKTSFAPGEPVTIEYDGAVKGNRILVFHNLAKLPLKDVGVTNGAKGTFEIPTMLQPGDYRVFMTDNNEQNVAATCFQVSNYPLPVGGTRIFVIADPHVLSPALVQDEQNERYVFMIDNDRKLIRYSYDIFLACLDTIRALKPDLVVIPGDLTKDGELLSHQAVAEGLQQLLDEGIPSLVIPGNHDLESRGAWSYGANNDREDAEVISIPQFEDIYRNFGYDSRSERDPYPNSLTYACEPLEGVVFIGIDDSRTTTRGDLGKDDPEFGRVPDETLQWVLSKVDEAVSSDKAVIVAIHHQLLQHYSGQEELMSSAATEQGDSIARVLADHGVRVVLTGHMHVPNISTIRGTETDSLLTEISSASPVSYPSQYRLLTISDDRTRLDVDTRYIVSSPRLEDVQQAAQEQIDATLDVTVKKLVYRNMSSFNEMLQQFAGIPGFDHVLEDVPSDPDSLAEIACDAFGETMRKVIFTSSEGNEQLKNAADIIIRQLETDCKVAADLVFDQQNMATRAFLATSMYLYLLDNAEDLLVSMLTDTTYPGTEDANQTDDLYHSIALKGDGTGIRTIVSTEEGPLRIYTVSGQYVGSEVSRLSSGVYVIREGRSVRKVTIK